MATDATGTPSTNFSIPKYLTSADPPSGKGFNATIDFIDNLLKNSFTTKPSGIATGEVPVWNGSTFARQLLVSTNTSANIGSANTDLGNQTGVVNYIQATTGGGTLRSVGSPSAGAGARFSLRNGSASNITIKHSLAGGTGLQLYLRTLADVVLLPNEDMQFEYDGAFWVETSRNVATTAATTELAYNEITTNATTSATTEGTATAVVPGTAVTYDGTAVMIEFFAPTWSHNTSGANMLLVLFDGSTPLGQLWRGNAFTGSQPMYPLSLHRKLTPSAGSHTYNVKGYVTSGTGTVVAGASGTGADVAAFLRISKAS